MQDQQGELSVVAVLGALKRQFKTTADRIKSIFVSIYLSVCCPSDRSTLAFDHMVCHARQV